MFWPVSKCLLYFICMYLLHTTSISIFLSESVFSGCFTPLWRINCCLLTLGWSPEKGFYVPFMRCLYYWVMPVSGQMGVFIILDWMVNFPELLPILNQYFPVGTTVKDYGEVRALVPWSAMFSTWFDIKSWPWSCLALILYQCTIVSLVRLS